MPSGLLPRDTLLYFCPTQYKQTQVTGITRAIFNENFKSPRAFFFPLIFYFIRGPTRPVFVGFCRDPATRHDEGEMPDYKTVFVLARKHLKKERVSRDSGVNEKSIQGLDYKFLDSGNYRAPRSNGVSRGAQSDASARGRRGRDNAPPAEAPNKLFHSRCVISASTPYLIVHVVVLFSRHRPPLDHQSIYIYTHRRISHSPK